MITHYITPESFINQRQILICMAILQSRSQKKQTGARYKDYRKRKKFEMGRNPTLTKVGETKKSSVRGLGGNEKTFLLNIDTVNLIGKDKKCVKAKITSVLENDANRNFVRRNILTKGTVIDTEKGKAKITSRPGQEGAVNAVLI